MNPLDMRSIMWVDFCGENYYKDSKKKSRQT